MAAGHVWGVVGRNGGARVGGTGGACGVLKFTGVRLRGGLARLRPAPPGTNGDCPLLPVPSVAAPWVFSAPRPEGPNWKDPFV